MSRAVHPDVITTDVIESHVWQVANPDALCSTDVHFKAAAVTFKGGRRMQRAIWAALAASVGSGLAGTAQAGIVAFGGAVVIADPPANIQNGVWTSNTEIRAWMERQTVLTSPLMLDAVNTGTVWQGNPNTVPGEVPAQTAVTSYMIRLDPINAATLSGFVQFDRPILGVIVLASSLNGSDSFLGRPGVTYNMNQRKGLDGEGLDVLTISPDRMRLDFTLETGEWTDDVRIVESVPTPASATVLALTTFLASRRRRTN